MIESQDSTNRLPLSYILTLCGLLAAGLLLRWLNLDMRPVHHDESLHYMYGRYFYDFPNQNFHRYDPMLHGPLLYNTLRLVYDTLGSSTWAGRSLVALLGSFFIFLPLLFRRFFHRDALVALTAAIALSPTHIYWSRFLREDMLQLSAIALALYAVVLAPSRWKAILFLVSIAVQWCIKANLFVHLAILAGFILYEWLFSLTRSPQFTILARSAAAYLKKYWAETLMGLVLAIFIYSYFYTSGYRYSQGLEDGIIRVFTYWFNQHAIERIPGPFMFHVFQLSWYEFIFMCVFIIHAAVFYLTTNFPTRIVGAILLSLIILCGLVLSPYKIEGEIPWKYLNLKSVLDVQGCLFLATHAVVVTTVHLIRGERALAFFGYFFLALFASYSYLGEKVPWLAMYPWAAGVVYFALYFQDYYSRNPIPFWRAYPWEKILRYIGIGLFLLGLQFFLTSKEAFTENIPKALGVLQTGALGALRNCAVLMLGAGILLLSFTAKKFDLLGTVNLKKFLFIVAIVFSIRAAIMVNHINGGKASEFISQVHTTEEFHRVILDIRKQVEVPVSGKKPTIYVTGESTWPSTWYLVDIPEFKFQASEEEQKNFDYRFIDYVTDTSKQFEGFKRIDLKLRGWWVPDYNQMTLERFLRYSFSFLPWSTPGYSYTTLLVKEPSK